MPSNSAEYRKKNYKKYWGTKKAIAKRVENNKGRRLAGLKVGDPREADHIKPLSKGGTTTKSNIRAISRKQNRRGGAKIANNRKGRGYKKSKEIK